MNCNKNNMFITLSVKLILIHAVSINIDTAIKKRPLWLLEMVNTVWITNDFSNTHQNCIANVTKYPVYIYIQINYPVYLKIYVLWGISWFFSSVGLLCAPKCIFMLLQRLQNWSATRTLEQDYILTRNSLIMVMRMVVAHTNCDIATAL